MDANFEGEPEGLHIGVEKYIKSIEESENPETKEKLEEVKEQVNEIPAGDEEGVRQILEYAVGQPQNEIKFLSLAIFSKNSIAKRPNFDNMSQQERDREAGEIFDSLARALNDRINPPGGPTNQ